MIHHILSVALKRNHPSWSFEAAWKVVEDQHAQHPCKGSGYMFIEYDGSEYRRIPSGEVDGSTQTVIFIKTFGDR